MSVWSRIRAALGALRNPQNYAPPPLPTAQPQQPPRRDREVERPPQTRIAVPITRAELPDDWGPNKAALWADATKFETRLAHDWRAQRFYDAALYTFASSHEERAENLENFITYVRETYGVDWNRVFDWAEYRRNYDQAGVSR